MVDDLAAGGWGEGDDAFEDPGDEPSDTAGVSSVGAKGELVEVGLNVVFPNCAVMGAEPPAFDESDGPMSLLKSSGGLRHGRRARLRMRLVRSAIDRIARVPAPTIGVNRGRPIHALG